MVKSYHRRVFGGKEAPWIGIDQGKGALYDGSIKMSLNATYKTTAVVSRDGQARVEIVLDGGVNSGANVGAFVVLSVGREIFVERYE